MSKTLPLGAKPGDYYSQQRQNVIAELPRPVGRVLDVGCAEGGANEPLRMAGAEWISGIEVEPEPAALAANRYDEVVVGDALEAVGRVTAPFDTILCYDVLEHLVNPSALLRRLRAVARDAGVLHVSVPNARHFSLVRDIVFRGTFGYSEYGHRDATHLRWFTRKDVTELLTETGWKVEQVSSSAAHRLRELRLRVPRRIIYGLPGEFLTSAWFILARASALS